MWTSARAWQSIAAAGSLALAMRSTKSSPSGVVKRVLCERSPRSRVVAPVTP